MWSGLRALVDHRQSVTVEAATVGDILTSLARDYPRLQPAIDAGLSVAVDGRIIATALDAPIPEGAEVVLMQRLRGG